MTISASLPSTSQRIVVVGTGGSGKTTLARQISQQLSIPHIELDALHWEPHWQEAEPDVFRSRVDQVLTGDRWVVDGNYSVVRDIVWSRATTLVWLDYSFPLTLYRITRRTLWRAFTQEEMWNGNRESWRIAFSKDSMIVWVLRTWADRRKKYPILLQQPEYAHLTVLRFTTPKATQTWLAKLAASPAASQ